MSMCDEDDTAMVLLRGHYHVVAPAKPRNMEGGDDGSNNANRTINPKGDSVNEAHRPPPKSQTICNR